MDSMESGTVLLLYLTPGRELQLCRRIWVKIQYLLNLTVNFACRYKSEWHKVKLDIWFIGLYLPFKGTKNFYKIPEAGKKAL